MAITKINVNGTEHSINDSRVDTLQTQLDKWGTRHVNVNTYKSSSQITGSVTLDNAVDVAIFGIRNVSGTAVENVNNISYSLSNNNKTVNILVNGTGFVSGHIVALSMIYHYS
jgi:hypothetical protein